MKNKAGKIITSAILIMVLLAGCGIAKKEPAKTQQEAFEGVTIIYTNDIHSSIANTVKDKDGNEVAGLRLSNISQMAKDYKADGKQVLLADAGDVVQGSIYGAMDEGESMIKLMNAVGYDVATLGNHEFDYGMNRMFQLTDMADYPYVTCNFHCLAADAERDPFDGWAVFEVKGKKIAFVGISTPETITSSTPVYFQNEKGEVIYDFDGSANSEDFFTAVQNAIDAAKAEADIVIGLAHVGVNENSGIKGITSRTMIQNTTGLDAVIDGHSHSTVEGEWITDKSGKEVLLSQTGSYLSAVGIMTIDANGVISTELVKEYAGSDSEVAALENELMERVNTSMGEEIGVLGTTMYVNNPEKEGQRLIRSVEMNSGDFTADAVYWYFNMDRQIDCDIAICNGGGIRTQLPAGPVKYSDIKNIHPFGNMNCLVYASGQEILDMLEMGATVTGEYDAELDTPAQNGGFMHVAGLKYTIDTSIPSAVKCDEKGMFEKVEGNYRVKGVAVYNRSTGIYEPMKLDKVYTLGGMNYLLRNGGNGLSMLMDNEMVVDYVGVDWVILSDYVKAFNCKEGESLPVVTSANSPLAAYKGYLLNYENPFGSGRIQIVAN